MIGITARGPLLTVAAATSLLIPVRLASAQSNTLYLTDRERGGEISIVQNGQVIAKNAQTPTRSRSRDTFAPLASYRRVRVRNTTL